MCCISVIVPVYNVADYIDACCESILKQQYHGLEVIFVDDCGTDDSVRKVSDFIAAHQGIECRLLHHDHNRGLSAARNTGLKAANGEYVYFLDSDDTMSDCCLECLSAPLDSLEYDFVIGEYAVDGCAALDLSMLQGELIGNDAVLQAYSEGRWYVMAWNKLCNRKFLIDNDLWFQEGVNHEDVIWSFKLACKARSMFAVRDVTYNYLVRSSSIMTGMSVEHDVQTYLSAFSYIVDFVKSEHRESGRWEYNLIEGKKCGIQYSLMEIGEWQLYRTYYAKFRQLVYISPVRMYLRHRIGLGCLLRDFHNVLPVFMGRCYKSLFYLLVYRLIHHGIDGCVWKTDR